jgi:hypothetical protein
MSISKQRLKKLEKALTAYRERKQPRRVMAIVNNDEKGYHYNGKCYSDIDKLKADNNIWGMFLIVRADKTDKQCEGLR